MPQPFERDFGMYIGDKPGVIPPTPTPTPKAVPVAPAPEASPATADLEKLAAEVWVPAWWEATPSPVVPPAWEVPPVWEVPSWEIPPAWEVPPTWEVPSAWEDISWDNLQKMLDALGAESEVWVKVTEEVKTAAKEVAKASTAWDNEALKKANEALTQEIAKLETNDLKNQKTIEIIKQEFQKTLNDKISLEYWTASDSKIAQLVNDDPDVKNLIAAKLATWDTAKDKLDQARRSGFENATGISVDSIIASKKEAEISAMAPWEAAWTEVSKGEKSLYL